LLAVISASVIIHEKVQPLDTKEVNHVEELSLITSMVIGYCGFYFFMVSGMNLVLDLLVLVLGFIFFAVFFISWISEYVRNFLS